jgi:hypothetical protein
LPLISEEPVGPVYPKLYFRSGHFVIADDIAKALTVGCDIRLVPPYNRIIVFSVVVVSYRNASYNSVITENSRLYL